MHGHDTGHGAPECAVELRQAAVEDMALKRPGRFWLRRRILVTGGAGFIGYALATRLAAAGAAVYVLDIKPSLPDFELEKGARKKITYIRGNVTSKKTLDRILRQKRIQTVFHLAAEAIVKRAQQDPVRALEGNARGMRGVSGKSSSRLRTKRTALTKDCLTARTPRSTASIRMIVRKAVRTSSRKCTRMRLGCRSLLRVVEMCTAQEIPTGVGSFPMSFVAYRGLQCSRSAATGRSSAITSILTTL